MGSIQSLLAIGAITIFSLISVRFNSSVLQNMGTEVESKVYLTAFSLADDMIEEIKQKAFDQKTVDFQAIKVTQLTAYDKLGPDALEVYPHFNDIDDYNGYNKPVSLPHAEGYEVTCKVMYVNSAGVEIFTQSYLKKVEVTVSSPYLRTPVLMSFIFSLHAKN